MPPRTPSGPSKSPPLSTESTCEPIKTAGASEFLPSRRPKRLPAASSRTARPASRMYEETRSLAARSSGVNERRATPPSSCLPISASSESLCHNRPPSTTPRPSRLRIQPTHMLTREQVSRFWMPGFGHRGRERGSTTSWPLSGQGAGLVEGGDEQLGVEAVGRHAVAAGHGAGGEQGVHDRRLGRLGRRVEERGHALVRQHPDGHGLRYIRVEDGTGQAAVAGGEGEEDVAAAVVEAAAHPGEADGGALGQPVALDRQQRRVRRQDDDDGAGACGLVGLLLVVRRGDTLLGNHPAVGQAVHAQRRTATVVGLYQRADDPPAPFVRDAPRGRADAALELVADHARTAADGALDHGPAGGVSQRLLYVLRPDVLAVYVVERPVVGLGHYRQGPVLLRPAAFFQLCCYQGVAHDAYAVGVRDGDGRGEGASLPDPLEPRHLPVAVEPVAPEIGRAHV